MKESDIETSLSATRRREVEARLAEMREKGIRPNEGQYFKELEEDGSDQEVDKITKKVKTCIIKLFLSEMNTCNI